MSAVPMFGRLNKRGTRENAQPSTCHKDRPVYHSSGLCRSCYSKKHYYGIDFVSMYAAQHGKCAICNQDKNESELYVDHEHDTMKVRGLLCSGCNSLVGWVEHSQHDAAVEYVRMSQ